MVNLHSDCPNQVKAWQLMGCTLQLMKPDEKQASLYVFRTGNLTDEQLAGSIIRMIQVLAKTLKYQSCIQILFRVLPASPLALTNTC
jgi:hypothetical protein